MRTVWESGSVSHVQTHCVLFWGCTMATENVIVFVCCSGGPEAVTACGMVAHCVLFVWKEQRRGGSSTHGTVCLGHVHTCSPLPSPSSLPSPFHSLTLTYKTHLQDWRRYRMLLFL